MHAGAATDMKKFLLPCLVSLLLAALCAWLFASALAASYPDGILVFAPQGSAPPRPSAAFHIGMALGWFFSGLCLLVVALSVFSLNKLKRTVLQHLPAPLFAASLVCATLLLLALDLAG
jgi:hypothetical protein